VERLRASKRHRRGRFRNMYITGATVSTNFPMANAFDATFGVAPRTPSSPSIGVPGTVTLSPTSLTFTDQTSRHDQRGSGGNAHQLPGYDTEQLPASPSPGPTASNFGQTNNCGTAWRQGELHDQRDVHPSATGTRTATLTVTTMATNSPQTAGLTGTGTALPASRPPPSP